jgi:hypothetical protein
MATGQGQGGGVFGVPDVSGLGAMTWGEMSGVHPDSPLVGGRGTPTGGIDPDYKYRRVATGAPPAASTAGTPMHNSHRELLNFSHSPMPWILIGLIAYLGLVHLHVSGTVSGRAGK